MRDNGLPAQSWAHLADVDPWLAQVALEALRDAGVAAYAVPHPGRAGPYLDVQLPDRPIDRLFVDVRARERAFEVLSGVQAAAREERLQDPPNDPAAGQNGGQNGDPDVDAAFAEIVSRLDLAPSSERSTDRHGESVGHDRAASTEVDDDVGPERGDLADRRRSAHIGWDDLLADEPTIPAAEPADLDDPDERFVPPPPPPVPRGTPLRRFAWAAVLGAPVVVALCTLFDYRLAGWTGLIVVLAFLTGLGTLFATLGERPDDDDPDHGAVV